MLAALEAVDLVVVFDEDTPLELIKTRASGGVWSKAPITELIRSSAANWLRKAVAPSSLSAWCRDTRRRVWSAAPRVRRACGPAKQACQNLTGGDASHDQPYRAVRH